MSRSKKVDLVYFILFFILFFIFIFFSIYFSIFLFLEQLGLGLICHTVTLSQPNGVVTKQIMRLGENLVENLRTNNIIQHGLHMVV